MIKERLINPLQPIGWRLHGDGIAQLRKSQIRPWPIHDPLNEPCPHRIAKNIADGRKKMAVLWDGETLEPPLPHMAVTPVMLMISPDMTGHPPLHEGAKFVTGGGRSHEMKMVGHQAEAKNLDRMTALAAPRNSRKARQSTSL